MKKYIFTCNDACDDIPCKIIIKTEIEPDVPFYCPYEHEKSVDFKLKIKEIKVKE